MKVIENPELKVGEYISCDLDGDGQYVTYQITYLTKSAFWGKKCTPCSVATVVVNFGKGPGKHVFGMFEHPKMLAYQYVPEWKDKQEQEEKRQ